MEKPSISEPSPLSPTRWTPDAFAWPRSLAALAAVLVAFVAGLALSSLVVRALHISAGDLRGEHLSWGILLAQLASYAVIVPTMIVVAPWAARRSLRELGVRPLDGPSARIGVLGAIGMYAVTLGIANLEFAFTHQKPSEAATTLFTSTHDPALAIGFGVLAIFIAPFVEEFAFRGFLFNALLRYAPVWLAATLSGALFGLSHGSPSALLPLAGSGIVLAYVYYRSGSLTASMLTHALFNAANLVLLAIGVST